REKKDPTGMIKEVDFLRLSSSLYREQTPSMNLTEDEFRNVVSGASSRFELWEQIIKDLNAEVVAEIGVWKGAFAKHMLKRCETIRRYYMIDPWANLPDWNKPFNVSPTAFNDVYAEAMQVTEFAAEKRTVLRGVSREVIDRILDESLDAGYIDGDHTLRGITIDLIKVLPKIKEGGLLGGDDFKTEPWQEDPRYEPTLVCPFSVYFAEAMNLPIVALPFNQFVIQKRNDSAFSFIDLTGQYQNLSLCRHSSLFNLFPIKRKAKRVLSKIGLKR
ncbi:MAG TPA: class I SAM-dependent methyltransferase, partial [Anaerolineales bacterium]|nr:class I SAM-dependent methyltransferase [Anaerolineales bacterium]